MAFNLCSSQYNEKTNIITFEVVVDKFYIDGVVKPIQDINGIYSDCNLYSKIGYTDMSFIPRPGRDSSTSQ